MFVTTVLSLTFVLWCTGWDFSILGVTTRDWGNKSGKSVVRAAPAPKRCEPPASTSSRTTVDEPSPIQPHDLTHLEHRTRSLLLYFYPENSPTIQEITQEVLRAASARSADRSSPFQSPVQPEFDVFKFLVHRLHPQCSESLSQIVWAILYAPFALQTECWAEIDIHEAIAFVVPAFCQADPSNLIMLAAAKNNHVAVKMLCRSGFPVDLSLADGGTALSIAVKWHFNDVIDTLLQAGAEIFPSNPCEAMQPVYLAAAEGNFEGIVKLLEWKEQRESILMWRTRDGKSIFDLALMHEQTEFLKRFIEEYGVDYVHFPNLSTHGKSLALATAISRGFNYLVVPFLQDGAEAMPTALRKSVQPVYLAAVLGNFEGLVKLMEWKEMRQRVLEWRTPNDRSVFSLACKYGRIEFLKKFIEKFGSGHMHFPHLTAKDRGTALAIAMKLDHDDLIESLLEDGDICFSSKLCENMHPAYLTAVEGNFKAISRLLKREGLRKCILEWRTHTGESIFDLAFMNGWTVFLQGLVKECGLENVHISHSVISNLGKNSMACFNRLIDTEPLWYYNTFKINPKLDLVFFAAETNNAHLASILDHKVEMKSCRLPGLSPLHMAAKSGSWDVLDFYLRRGELDDFRLEMDENLDCSLTALASEFGHANFAKCIFLYFE